jgi:osmotically-inducible protein OsmY
MSVSLRAKPLAFIVLLASLVTGCAWIEGRETGGQYVDDASISTRLRGSIIADPLTKLSQIDVETMQGTVQLSGFVDNAQARSRAEELARNQSGVKAVRNNLAVRSPSTNRSTTGTPSTGSGR